jgi:Mrp family chromosome partitioning ATPase
MQATDAAVLVVRSRKTQAETLTRAWYYLVRSRTYLLGAILNEATPAESVRHTHIAHQKTRRDRDNVAMAKTASG